jgi:hypothetical protein
VKSRKRNRDGKIMKGVDIYLKGRGNNIERNTTI